MSIQYKKIIKRQQNKSKEKGRGFLIKDRYESLGKGKIIQLINQWDCSYKNICEWKIH